MASRILAAINTSLSARHWAKIRLRATLLLLSLAFLGQPRLTMTQELTDLASGRKVLCSLPIEVDEVSYEGGLVGDPPTLDASPRLIVNDELLSNGQFVYGPNVADFNLAAYLSQNESELVSWAERIDAQASFASVNPKVLLTILDLLGYPVAGSSEAVSRTPMTASRSLGLERTIRSLVGDLVGHFYYRMQEAKVQAPYRIALADKSFSGVGPEVNAGTFAVLATLGPLMSRSEWEELIDPLSERSFMNTYKRLFPADDPLDNLNDLGPVEKAFRSGASAAAALPDGNFLQLPFPVGESWQFSGTHAWCGIPGEPGCAVSQPLSSMDLSPNFPKCPKKCKSDVEGYANSQVVAAAEGTAQASKGCFVRINHEGGWSTSYYHLTGVDLPADGLDRGESFANIGCECCSGGSAQTAHVHFALLFNGAHFPLDGVKLSGWTVHSGAQAYGQDTYLEKNGKKIFALNRVTNTPNIGKEVEFSAAAFPVDEGAGSITITVVRKGDASSAATVKYATTNGTASRGSDYRLASDVLSFGAGQASKTFLVPIVEDAVEEGDETINLTLSEPTGGASLGALKTAVITIKDNDHGPKLEFSAASVSVRENVLSVTVTVNRVGPAGGTVDVGYSTENGSAVGELDFRPRSGRVTFVAGVSSRAITVPIIDDFSREGTESFSLRLFDASGGAAVGKQDRISVLIEDDETIISSPFIDRVSPLSYAASNSNQTMDIFGSNFQNGATLTFDPPTGQNIASTPARLTFISSGQLRYQFNSGNVAGNWTVTVKNPDGQPSNTVNFAVTPAPGPGPSVPATPTGTNPGSASSPGPTTGGATVTMSWNPSSGATSYSFGVRDMTSNQLVVDTTTGNTSFTANLSAGRQYRWNVAACNSAGCSAFTTALYFQTPGGSGVSVPPTPTGTNPGSTSSPGPTTGSTTVTMSWNSSSGATSYSFGVRDMISNQLVVDTTTSNTSFTAGLSAGRQYRWNVAACNSAGCSSFTTALYFQTPGVVSVPQMPTNASPGSPSSPGPTTGSTTVTMNWSDSNGATSYSFGVRDMISNQLVVDTTTGSTSFTAGLSAGRQYRWNVAACNSAGCSAFTAPLYFQTPGGGGVSVPSTPTGTSPGSTSSPGPTTGSTTVTMSWNSSSGATSYSFGVRDMISNQLVVDTTTGNTSFTAGLSASRQYRWNVAACNSAGCSSFTTPLYFQTPGGGGVSVPPTPTGTSPGSTSSPGPMMGSTTVTMSWNSASGATSYSFGVRDMISNQLVVDTTTGNTSFTAGLSAGRQYRWNVAACNSAGCSSFTTPLYFQTPGGVTVPSTPTGTSPGSTSSPGPTMGSSTVTMSWNSSSGATSYSFGVRDMISNQLVVDTTTGNTSFTAGLSAGRQYRWNVAACNSAGCSSFTTPLYFQTPGGVTVPPTPTGTSPGSTSSPGPTMGSSTVTMDWNSASGATSYSFGVRDMISNQLVVDTTTSNTSFTASLSAGRRYRWNVAACNSAGCSSFTTPLYFQTPGGVTVPSMPTGTGPGSTSSPGPTMGSRTVTMSWNSSSGATSYSFGVRDMISNQLVVDTTTSNTFFTATLSAGRRYRWNVAACNSAGCSSFTTPLYFQTP